MSTPKQYSQSEVDALILSKETEAYKKARLELLDEYRKDQEKFANKYLPL